MLIAHCVTNPNFVCKNLNQFNVFFLKYDTDALCILDQRSGFRPIILPKSQLIEELHPKNNYHAGVEKNYNFAGDISDLDPYPKGDSRAGLDDPKLTPSDLF